MDDPLKELPNLGGPATKRGQSPMPQIEGKLLHHP